jgi:nitroimidazol reductase NimA-like FMN-containing flavoprotein (pyridoxamine 5'-phosphate oxidase superfamily)
MFRPVQRVRQQLPEEECLNILKNEKRGVLSVLGDDGYPYGMPLNHYYNEADGKLYFHSGKQGHKIDAINADNRVSFCVYDEGFKKDGEWALNIRSVIVFGRIEIVEDYDTAMAIVRQLSLKYTDDISYIDREIQQSGKNTLVFRLVPEHITGKLVNES